MDLEYQRHSINREVCKRWDTPDYLQRLGVDASLGLAALNAAITCVRGFKENECNRRHFGFRQQEALAYLEAELVKFQSKSDDGSYD